MKNIKTALSSILSLLLLASCGFNDKNTLNSTVRQEKNSSQIMTVLKGKVNWPQGFDIKATVDDIIPYGTVSLLYPHDHDTMANRTIATGLTDSEGNFIINPGSFNALNEEVYVLEVIKRLGGVNKKVLTLRTFVIWDGEWRSITFPDIVINNETTALAIISEHKNISAIESIATISLTEPTDNAQIIDENHLKIVWDYEGKVYLNSATNSFSPVLLSPEGLTGNSEPKFSPDGSKVTWINDNEGFKNINIGNADGSGEPVVIGYEGTAFSPVFSPDSSKIAWLETESETSENVIYLINADGSGDGIYIAGNVSSSPIFSPDGGKILWKTNNGATQQIYVGNSDGTGEPVLIADNVSTDTPGFSSDSSKVLWVGSDGTTNHVYIGNADGTGTVLALSDGTSTMNQTARLSPDGTKVVWAGRNPVFFLNEIYVSNSDGSGTPITLSEIAGNVWYPSFSPDGTKVTWGGSGVYVRNADGSGEVKELNGGTDVLGAPIFSPDGNKVVWEKDSAGLFMADADGSTARVRITDKRHLSFSMSVGTATFSSDQTIVADLVIKALNKNIDPVEVISFDGAIFGCSICE